MSNSLWPCGCSLPGSWNSPGKNSGVGCHVLLQGIFPTQRLNPFSCGSCIAGRFLTVEPPGRPERRLICCCSVAKSRLTLCNPTDCSTAGFPVLHHLPEFAQTHVHWVSDAIQWSHLLSSSSPPAFSLTQHQSLTAGRFFPAEPPGKPKETANTPQLFLLTLYLNDLSPLKVKHWGQSCSYLSLHFFGDQILTCQKSLMIVLVVIEPEGSVSRSCLKSSRSSSLLPSPMADSMSPPPPACSLPYVPLFYIVPHASRPLNSCSCLLYLQGCYENQKLLK